MSTSRRNGEANSSPSALVALILVALVVVVVVTLARSALETPSGEGVPGPGDWPRQERSQPLTDP
jgi:hypothetical protein